jgi:hypothetical protein
MGTAPATDEVAHLGECIRRSYTSMRIVGDLCLQACRHPMEAVEAAA